MLARVGLPKPADSMKSYPFELSGGMRQRVCIAMALVCEPPTAHRRRAHHRARRDHAGRHLDLVRDLQKEMGMSVMFITHDLGVVAEIADEVVVMYLGKAVERGSVRDIFYDPKHPYTKSLLRSNPQARAGPARTPPGHPRHGAAPLQPPHGLLVSHALQRRDARRLRPLCAAPGNVGRGTRGALFTL